MRVDLTDHLTAEETVPDTMETVIQSVREMSPAFQSAVAEELARLRGRS